MSRVARVAMGAVLLALTQASFARAASQCIPSWTLSTVPRFIRVVGTHGGEPDPAGLFVVTVRDFNNVPIANSQVVLDFINCLDVRLCSDQPDPATVDCPTRTVRCFSDGAGIARFIILGAARNRSGDPGTEGAQVRVIADGVTLAMVTAVVPDENGALTTQGVEATDLSSLIADLGAQVYRARSDFNEDGVLGGADLARWLTWHGQGRSRDGCPARAMCP
jgi:hypothetical protein